MKNILFQVKHFLNVIKMYIYNKMHNLNYCKLTLKWVCYKKCIQVKDDFGLQTYKNINTNTLIK